jgi:uncharacterized protein YehS (DUF1456 family)
VTHNTILDTVRASLKLTDAKVLECFTLGGSTLSPEALADVTPKVQGEAETVMTDALLAAFLDGLIVSRRGPTPSSSSQDDAVVELTNNTILKKLRIALNLQAEGMLKLFDAGGKTLTRGELTVLFRKPTHKHYKACGDELFLAFFEGMKKSEEFLSSV